MMCRIVTYWTCYAGEDISVDGKPNDVDCSSAKTNKTDHQETWMQSGVSQRIGGVHNAADGVGDVCFVLFFWPASVYKSIQDNIDVRVILRNA